MSRRSPGAAQGLSGLRAAVREVRCEQLARSARAGSMSWDVLDLQRTAGRVAVPSRLPAGSVPSPTQPEAAHGLAEGEAPAPAEGEAALSFALVQRAQAGGQDAAEAFGKLYDCYVDQVFRYIVYRVPSRQLAEDLTSETFLRALRRIGTFTWQGRDVGAWFTTIARNLIADHYKSSRYRLELTIEDVTDSGAGPVQDGPEDQVLEAMQNQVLLGAIRQLGPEQQECIVLRFLQGLSVAETAAVMGKNDGAIKALQYRATRTLGRLLPEGVEL